MRNNLPQGLTASGAYNPFEGGSRGFRRVCARITGLKRPAEVCYGLGLVALAAGVAAASDEVWGFHLAPAWALLTLAVFAIAVESQAVRISANTELTVSFIPLLLAAVVYGPLTAMIVAATALALEFRQPYARWLVWTGSRMVAGGAAGLAAIAIFAPQASIGRLFGAVCAAAAAEAGVDALCSAGILSVRGVEPFGRHLRSLGPVVLATTPLHAPIIALLAYAYLRISPWAAILFFGPAFAAQRFYRLYQEQREATAQLALVNSQLEQANLSFATALVATLDARDHYTAGHSAAVAIYARDIARRMGLTEREQRLAHLCGLVHDVGKIGLPSSLLEKPGPLSLEERKQMELHSVIGERILCKVDDYSQIAKVVRHHHERVDGLGYPDGLLGEEIPLISRIIGVADAYNAMTSDRPYRDAMPSRVARLRLAQAVESQFDTSVVAAFEAILASADEEYRMGASAAFSFDGESVEPAEESSTPVVTVVALSG